MKRYPYIICLFCSLVLVLGFKGIKPFFHNEAGTETFLETEETSGQAEAALPKEEESAALEAGGGTAANDEGSTDEEMAGESESAEGMPEETPAGEEGSMEETLEDEEAKTAVSPENQVSPGPELFADALFIGDSRTVGLMEYGNLGDALVFANTGMNVFEVGKAQVKTSAGKKQTLDEVLSEQQFGKIYIMLGLNELGYPPQSIVKKYRSVLEEIKEKQPSALIFLQANLHVSAKRSASSDIYNNGKIDQLNHEIEAMTDNSRVFYLDINPMFDDGAGNLDASYTADDAHVLGKYYDDWTGWLMEQTAAVLNGFF